MVTINERDNAGADEKIHVINNCKNKLQEPHFVQLTKNALLIYLTNLRPNAVRKDILWKLFAKDDIFEFHVDDLDAFSEIAKEWPSKGSTSICNNPAVNIRILFSQDKSACFPHFFKNFCWSFQDHIAQRNKTEGMGLIVSLLISRDFG